MPSTTSDYQRLLRLAADLEPADQLRLLQGLMRLVGEEGDTPGRHNVRELRGLGKHLWRGVDAQEYVDRERAAWDG